MTYFLNTPHNIFSGTMAVSKGGPETAIFEASSKLRWLKIIIDYPMT